MQALISNNNTYTDIGTATSYKKKCIYNSKKILYLYHITRLFLSFHHKTILNHLFSTFSQKYFYLIKSSHQFHTSLRKLIYSYTLRL